MLTSEELTSMRAEVERAMPDACRFKTWTLVSDGAGGSSRTSALGAAVECRLSPAATGQRSAEGEIAARLGIEEGFMLTLPFSQAVDEKQQVEVSGEWGVKTLEIAMVMGPRSWEISRRVLCTEIG